MPGQRNTGGGAPAIGSVQCHAAD